MRYTNPRLLYFTLLYYNCTSAVKCCYVTEGALQKAVGRRLTDRYVFLFDGLIILTKQKSRISVTGPVGDYKLKEKYHVRLLDITDRDDTDGRCFLLSCENR